MASAAKADLFPVICQHSLQRELVCLGAAQGGGDGFYVVTTLQLACLRPSFLRLILSGYIPGTGVGESYRDAPEHKPARSLTES